jgi:hypothetical protein
LSEGVPFKISISFDDWKNKRNPIFKGTIKETAEELESLSHKKRLTTGMFKICKL